MTLYEDLKWRGLIKDVTSPELEEKLNKGGMTFYIGNEAVEYVVSGKNGTIACNDHLLAGTGDCNVQLAVNHIAVFLKTIAGKKA